MDANIVFLNHYLCVLYSQIKNLPEAIVDFYYNRDLRCSLIYIYRRVISCITKWIMV